MKIHSFSIKNYRSIFTIKNLIISEKLTTFIGKNNEGKSNILKALSLIFDVINYNLKEIPKYFYIREIDYDWDNDFPIQRQAKKNNTQKTYLELKLHLSDKDIIEYKETINKSNV